MSVKTLSASLEGELVQRTREVAERERRSQSSVVSSALDLYTALSPVAHQVLEEVSRRSDMDEVAEQIERALLRIQWNRMAEDVDPVLRERVAGLSDQDLMDLADAAVDEVRRARAGRE